MNYQNELSKIEIFKAIESKEFSKELLTSAETVIIAMTQDWCPQWIFMKRWLYKLVNENCKVYEVIYNNKDYSNNFMSFKENTFGNDLVPYVRIYKKGMFFKDCNYRSQSMFKQILEKEKI
ncbi:MAG: hypothetical protein ABF289_04560 [Clostridiales bacterium]